jgi:hypothetical protein
MSARRSVRTVAAGCGGIRTAHRCPKRSFGQMPPRAPARRSSGSLWCGIRHSRSRIAPGTPTLFPRFRRRRNSRWVDGVSRLECWREALHNFADEREFIRRHLVSDWWLREPLSHQVVLVTSRMVVDRRDHVEAALRVERRRLERERHQHDLRAAAPPCFLLRRRIQLSAEPAAAARLIDPELPDLASAPWSILTISSRSLP